jgi:hypothetical protein
MVDVEGIGGAIDHGDQVGDYLQPVGGLHLAAEGKLGKVFHEERNKRCCLLLSSSITINKLYFQLYL